MEFQAGTTVDLPSELMLGLARYRHKVFVEHLGWKLPAHGEEGLEVDQFDRPDTLYVIGRNRSNQVVGSARLLPTVKPYLLGEVFPQLLGGAPLPHSPDVWELSRFAAVDFDSPSTTALSQFSSPIATGLLRAALAAARRRGARQLITVSPVGVERLLRLIGFRAQRAAPPIVVNGEPLFACLIDCDQDGPVQ